MKKILLAVALLTVTAGTSFAGISTTKHNLSSSQAGGTALIFSDNQSQICVFCHTPHNAIQSVPLWNRSYTPSGAFLLYTSSKSLTTTTQNSELFSDSQSLFCMSCHDGTVTELASRVNKQGVTDDGAAINMTGGEANWQNGGAAMLGTNLTNDHPVGFSYGQAYADEVASNANGLNAAGDVSTAFGGKTVFFKSTGGSDMMECSSCHAVHDNTHAPFLRTTNAGSTLCLACHAK